MNDAQGWHVALVGLPWWLVLPAATLLAWVLVRLQARETSHLPPRAGLVLRALRAAAAVAVVILLLEPTLSRDIAKSELPAVAVMVDTSGSMAAADARMAAVHRLDEAIALGLVPAELRPDLSRRAARELISLDEDYDAMTAALAAQEDARRRGDSSAQGGRIQAGVAAKGRPVDLCAQHLERTRAFSKDLAGTQEFSDHFHAQEALLERLIKALSVNRGEVVDTALAADVASFRERVRALAGKLEAAQAAADSALVAGAEKGSPVAGGLATLGAMSRYERARAIVERSIMPALAGKAEITVMPMLDHGDDHPDLGKMTPSGSTNFADALSYLAREWPRNGEAHVGGVILVSDGRQTAGGDALPAVRSLAARGARVAGVVVGDPDAPRDAVVAELGGAAEVFKGETVRLDARLRITGYDQADWDLILTRDGLEIERRNVRGTGAWQTERFERPDQEPGLHTWQVRLERAGAAASAVRAGGGLTREVWTGLPGTSVHEMLEQSSRKPVESSRIGDASTADPRENYGERLRGYILPPASGPYVFWISSDDGSDLRLSPSRDPREAKSIATVPDWVPENIWDKYESQHSQPVSLEAGKAYYIEVLHKQGLGGAHLAIGWQMPDNKLERPIPRTRLAPAADAAKAEDNANSRDDLPEASMTNNQADCTVAVVDDPLKVLLIDSAPRWDARYLVSMFERDRRVQVDRRYRSVLLARGGHELLPPTQGQLDAFDIVVLGDLTAAEIPPEDQTRLEKFVSNRGGFLVCMSGPRGMPASFGLGGIANVLPVRAGTTATVTPQAVTASLPERDAARGAALDSAITTVLDDPALNRKLWPALPALQWSLPGITTKPGSDVLLVSQGAVANPLAAVCRYGAGRVLWMGTDETWRWRDRLGDRVHQAFWLQAVRWGLGSRLRGKDPRLQVAVDRMLIEPGETVELRARARTSAGLVVTEPPQAHVRKIDDDGKPVPGSEQTLALRALPDAEGLFHAGIANLGEGRWQLTVSSDHPELSGLTEVRDVLVRTRASLEGVELAADPANLARLAAAGGFHASGMPEAAALAKELATNLVPTITRSRTVWRLWDGYGVLVAVVGLLSLEWLWRKRQGLP